MTIHQLHRLLAAPEIIVVDLLDSALTALHVALLVEHPLLGGPPTGLALLSQIDEGKCYATA